MAASAVTVAAASIVLLVLTPPAAGRCDAMKDVRVKENAGQAQLNGAKEYAVVVTNTAGVPVSGIHLYCGYDFHTVSPVDPDIIALVRNGDCLLRRGGAIAAGGSVTFSYTSYTRYSMDLLAATCNDGSGGI
ncbi:unnamed protein product [Urochloa decumbens]|uniref:Uncharacterized protein n=1 Tax=Urochloa decumbens TaxID=240449 RepID=A0ABC9B516_9POAL